ncbi:hypothetical protein P692DRAFT_20930716 [Suillus brevipes Sb2]|nr:hypothetical protein P692DRAFT_20930716 [Suillus brevipes Sb2]
MTAVRLPFSSIVSVVGRCDPTARSCSGFSVLVLWLCVMIPRARFHQCAALYTNRMAHGQHWRKSHEGQVSSKPFPSHLLNRHLQTLRMYACKCSIVEMIRPPECEYRVRTID